MAEQWNDSILTKRNLVQRRIDELDKERESLLSRLRILKTRQKRKDPNFDYTQVPASPEKKHISKAEHSVDEKSLEKCLIAESKRNNNETFLHEKLARPGSTSYFSEQLQNAREKNHEKSTAKLELLSHRISTFDGNLTNDYTPKEVDEVEEFSGQHIKIRYLPKELLNSSMKNIKVLRLPKLFSKIRPPHFQEPEYSNWVVVGTISKKTEPRLSNSMNPKKYFSLTVTDFNFDLTVVLFGKELVERYFKLAVGEIIAILNPEIMPWKKADLETQKNSSSFSLKLAKDVNNIIEIGYSKDLGFCDFMLRKKGTKCGVPINRSKQQYCDYHREQMLRHSGARRIELSGSVTMRAPIKNGRQQSLVKDQLGKTKSRISFASIPGRENKESQSQSEAKRFLFSSSNASSAFFDEDFANPDILANLDNKRRKIKEVRNNRLLEDKLKGLEKSLQTRRDEELNPSTKKSAEFTMLHNGFIQNPNVEAELLKGKVSGDKNVIIDQIRNTKKHVVLKPTKEQMKEKIKRRNEIYTKIMHEKDRTACEPQLDDSSDELEIL